MYSSLLSYPPRFTRPIRSSMIHALLTPVLPARIGSFNRSPQSSLHSSRMSLPCPPFNKHRKNTFCHRNQDLLFASLAQADISLTCSHSAFVTSTRSKSVRRSFQSARLVTASVSPLDQLRASAEVPRVPIPNTDLDRSEVAKRNDEVDREDAELAGARSQNDEGITDEKPPESADWKVGAFQQLPAVSPAYEIIGTALKRARMVKPSRGIMNVAKRERSRGAKQLDTLVKELSGPLGLYIKKFPPTDRLHPFERSLLVLTLGDGVYEETLRRVDGLRKRVLDVGKNAASLVNKTSTRKDAEDRLAEGYARVEDLYQKNCHAVDALKEVAKTLRAMPVVHPRIPTLCLVGAPNVGKSSLVRVLSSGKPEVCNYPFTTRGISMGHFFVDSRRHQVTDTPGLLHRPEDERNNIERLTIAALAHLPTAVLFVHDLTGECGTSLQHQFALHAGLKERFGSKPWIDVVSKADLLPPLKERSTDSEFATSPSEQSGTWQSVEEYSHHGPMGALRVSTQTQEGLEELVERVQTMLAARKLGEESELGDTDFDFRVHSKSHDAKLQRKKEQEEFYFPALPPEMMRGT